MPRKLRLGTRGSPLALVQANLVKALFSAYSSDLDVEICTIKTQGDLDKKTPLSQLGGKGVFVKTLEIALLRGEIDVAVHSLKDMTSQLPDELVLAGFIPGGSSRDVLVLKEGLSIESLPKGAKIATGSLRRKALLRTLRPEWAVTDIRGNIDTRLQKLENGAMAGVVLAEAGLVRLGLDHRIGYRFSPEVFYPAPGQGVLALETRGSDSDNRVLCNAISDPHQAAISTLELLFLSHANLDCRAPLGLYTTLENQTVMMKLFLASTRMTHFLEKSFVCSETNAVTEVISFGKTAAAWFEANSSDS